MNVNEYGVDFAFSTGFDMSAFTAISIVFTKPDGTTLTVSNPNVTVPNVDLTTTLGVFTAKTYAQYTFVQNDVNQAGPWSARVVYDNTTLSPPQHLISDVGTFTVNT